jgi:iron(III) transport system permease protein
VAVSFLVLWPLFHLQERALADDFQGYRDLGSVPGMAKVVYVTVLLGTVCVAMALILGVLLAWAMTRLPPMKRRILAIVPVASIVTPGVAVVLGWIFLFSPGVGYGNELLRKTSLFEGPPGPIDVYTVTWIVLFTGFSLTAFVYLFVNSALQNIGPEYEEAAVVCGAGTWRAFFSVTLPLLRPAIVYAGGTVLLLGLGQFAGPLLLGRNQGIDVLTTKIFFLTQAFPINYGLGAALGSPLLIVGVLIIVAMRLLIGDANRFVVSRRGSGKPWTTRSRGVLPAALIVTYGAIATGLPLLAITYVAFSPFWSGTIGLGALTTQNIDFVFSQPALVAAMTTSIKASAVAMLIVIPLGLCVSLSSLSTSRTAPILRLLLEVTSALPLGIPAALFGFAILFSYSGRPFQLYGSFWIVVVAYVTVMLPYATRVTGAALVTLGAPLIEASRVAGAGAIRTFFSIIVPLIRPAIASAAALIVVLLFHEFGASLMVASGNLQVMGTILYQLWNTGIYPQVAVMALLMVAMTLGGMGVAWAIVHIHPSALGKRLWHKFR